MKKIIDHYLAISKKDQRVLAVGIGGSGFHSGMDEYSDIDFFVLVKRNSILPYMVELSKTARKIGEVCIEDTLGAKEGFGNRRYWVILSNLLRVEFNIDSWATLEPHPFRKFTQILLDKDGSYTKFISEASKNNFDKKNEMSRIAKEFYFTCDKVYVNLSREHLWAAIFYVERLRYLLCQLLRINKNHLIWPQRPLKKFEKDFSQKTCEDLRNSLIEYDKIPIWNAFKYLMGKFESETVYFADKNNLEPVINDQEAFILKKWLNRSRPNGCTI